MVNENLALYVASYDDPASAEADFKSLKDAQKAEEFKVVSAVVASRDNAGNTSVDEHGFASPVGRDTEIGAAGGLLLGLFAPPLLAATAIGGGIGAGIGWLQKKHEEKELGVDADEYLPPGSSAVIVVADDKYLDHIDKALAKSEKKINKAIEQGDYEKLQKELDAADERVSKAVDS